jgi:hypothetical protein
MLFTCPSHLRQVLAELAKLSEEDVFDELEVRACVLWERVFVAPSFETRRSKHVLPLRRAAARQLPWLLTAKSATTLAARHEWFLASH